MPFLFDPEVLANVRRRIGWKVRQPFVVIYIETFVGMGPVVCRNKHEQMESQYVKEESGAHLLGS